MDTLDEGTAAIYARISDDRAGAGLGVERQEADCRALAEKIGWPVGNVYVDNDISAYSGRPRPQYRAMLASVKAGETTALIVWHTDRLHRRMAELEEFMVIAEERHLQIRTVTAGDLDLTSPSGRMVARMLGAVAQHEVDHMRERMRLAQDQLRRLGKFAGGSRPFGYEADGMRVRQKEAAAIREATQWVLEGGSLASMAERLNGRGILTARGNVWDYNRLEHVLLRPRNAGLTSKGLPGEPGFELVGKARWPAIVTGEQWQAMVAIFTKRTAPMRIARDLQLLGTGNYLCGVCGAPMRWGSSGGRTGGTKGRIVKYRCLDSRHPTITASRTDPYIEGVVADLVRERGREAIPSITGLEPDEARGLRIVLASKLVSLDRNYAAGRITTAQLRTAAASVNAEFERIDDKRLEARTIAESSYIWDASDPSAAFRSASMNQKRAILATVLRVEVFFHPHAGGQWTSDRIRTTPLADVTFPPPSPAGRFRPLLPRVDQRRVWQEQAVTRIYRKDPFTTPSALPDRSAEGPQQ